MRLQLLDRATFVHDESVVGGTSLVHIGGDAGFSRIELLRRDDDAVNAVTGELEANGDAAASTVALSESKVKTSVARHHIVSEAEGYARCTLREDHTSAQNLQRALRRPGFLAVIVLATDRTEYMETSWWGPGVSTAGRGVGCGGKETRRKWRCLRVQRAGGTMRSLRSRPSLVASGIATAWGGGRDVENTGGKRLLKLEWIEGWSRIGIAMYWPWEEGTTLTRCHVNRGGGVLPRDCVSPCRWSSNGEGPIQAMRKLQSAQSMRKFQSSLGPLRKLMSSAEAPAMKFQ